MNHLYFPANSFLRKTFVLNTCNSYGSWNDHQQINSFIRNGGKKPIPEYFQKYLFWFLLMLLPVFSYSQVVEYNLGKQLLPDTTATFPFPEPIYERDTAATIPFYQPGFKEDGKVQE